MAEYNEDAIDAQMIFMPTPFTTSKLIAADGKHTDSATVKGLSHLMKKSIGGGCIPNDEKFADGLHPQRGRRRVEHD